MGEATAPGARPWLLYATVFLTATAGLVYELVAGAVASYVLGDSVTQFSLVIGLYLSALGVGAYVSKFVERRLAARFVDVELSTALVGGALAPLLLYASARGFAFRPLLWGSVALVGGLVGLELPLLMRLLEARESFRELVAKALLFDYLGSLAASLLFALVLVPRAGLIRTGVLAGLVNAAVGLGVTFALAGEAGGWGPARARALAVLALLGALFWGAERVGDAAEAQLYGEPVFLAAQSAHQRVALAGSRAGAFSLYLNNNLQFSSSDEHRYHEALVHPAFAALAPGAARRALVAGGGDGLALREILKYDEVESVTLVELDPLVTALAAAEPAWRARTGGAFADPRLRVVHDDAMGYLARSAERFDLVVVDFPDPNNLSLGKLYTTRFYRDAARHLAPGGALVVQATSPYYSRGSFWSVVTTIEAAGLFARPYHAFVPSFGEWGFVLARAEPFAPPRGPRLGGLSFAASEAAFAAFFHFPPDVSRVPAPVNRADDQALVRLYEGEIGRYAH
ncbi:MAG TPA: polyamine aminopropyltransferase [Polyangiaceae bacterium]|nr:polyamine aminopropyltransferase [Polyangiaceae bacterium]